MTTVMQALMCMQALSVAELYGVLDTDTRDWTDGLLSNIFREVNKPLPAGKVRGYTQNCRNHNITQQMHGCCLLPDMGVLSCFVV